MVRLGSRRISKQILRTDRGDVLLLLECILVEVGGCDAASLIKGVKTQIAGIVSVEAFSPLSVDVGTTTEVRIQIRHAQTALPRLVR